MMMKLKAPCILPPPLTPPPFPSRCPPLSPMSPVVPCAPPVARGVGQLWDVCLLLLHATRTDNPPLALKLVKSVVYR